MNNEDGKTTMTMDNQMFGLMCIQCNAESFKFVKFSPCETMFATSEVNVLIKFKSLFYLINNLGFPLIKIWHIQGNDIRVSIFLFVIFRSQH